MNFANAIDPQAVTCVPCPEAEKVGVRHILLTLPQQRVSAKVGTFFAADRVLLSWTMRAAGKLECEFEIVYDDGQVLAGEYRFKRKSTSRPALMAFIRKTMHALCEGGGHPSPVRGLTEGPQRFLARYETDDFNSI